MRKIISLPLYIVLGILVIPAYTLSGSITLPPFEPPTQLAAVGDLSGISSDVSGETMVSTGSSATLAALMRPAIVRIMLYWQGTSTISGFMFNPTTGLWGPDSRVKKPIETPYEFYTGGSGFFVSPDGYILSNSHVVSTKASREAIAQELYYSYAYSVFYNLNTPEIYTWYKNLTLDQRAKLSTDGIKYIEKQLAFNSTPSLSLIKPAVDQATSTSATDLLLRIDIKKIIKDLVTKGIPATVVYVNDKYEENEEDFALIKINQTNLPYLHIGASATASIGQAVFHFGYPSTADLFSFTGDPTLTRGSVNALKDSIQSTFKYIQTDAKLSSGSSGSPLLNDQSLVLGIVTRASGGGLFSAGDGFGFAFPIDRVKETFTRFVDVPTSHDDYFSLLVQAFSQKEGLHCRAAIEMFELAKQTNMMFGDVVDKINEQIDSCNKIIASGKSLDSAWDYARNWIGNKGMGFWGGTVIAITLVAAAVIAFISLLRRLKREENLLESYAQKSQSQQTTTATTSPIVAMAPSSTDSFIVQNRAAGKTDQQIIELLVTGGWSREDAVKAVAPKS